MAELMEEMMADRWVSRRVDLKDSLMAARSVVMLVDLKAVHSEPSKAVGLVDRWGLSKADWWDCCRVVVRASWRVVYSADQWDVPQALQLE